jgi:2-oxoglutarate ferredoxin oxidoreductase subunit delta
MAGTRRGERFQVSVNRDWCKGCSICVAFCPTQVLGLDGEEKAVVLRPEACTGCRLCELRCPDFAISVAAAGATAQAPDTGPEADRPDAGRDLRSPDDD